MHSTRNAAVSQRLLLAAKRGVAPSKPNPVNYRHNTGRVAYAPPANPSSHESDDSVGTVLNGEAFYETHNPHEDAGPAPRPLWNLRRVSEPSIKHSENHQIHHQAPPQRQSPLSFVAPAAQHFAPGFALPFAMPHATSFAAGHNFLNNSQSFPVVNPILDLNAERLRSGTVVEFHTNGSDHRLGLITKSVDDAGEVFWVSEPSQSGPHNTGPTQRMVSNKDITFVWPRKHRNVVFEYTLENLPALSRHASQLVQQNNNQIPIVWGSYVDSKRSQIQTQGLAEFLFGAQPKPHELYVAHRLLQENTVYFKSVDRYSYSCRSLAEVQQEKKNLQAKAKEEQDAIGFLHRLQKKLSHNAEALRCFDSQVDISKLVLPVNAIAATSSLEWNPSNDQPYLEQLKNYALASPLQPPSERTYSALLKPLSISKQPEKVFSMLVQLGVMHKYENPHLARFPRKLDFEQAELKHYAQMSTILEQNLPPSLPTPSIPSSIPRLPASVDRDAGHRRDLRAIGPAFAIDNASGSDEIDDAISLDERPDGSRWIYVHIGDPSRLVAPNDELDMLARQRAQSVYLPERGVGMFPPSLARNQFSLRPGKLNFALSFGFRLSAEGEVDEYEICPSVIDQVHCLTYEQADDLLRQDPATFTSSNRRHHAEVIRKLVDISTIRKERRIARGAVVLAAPRADLIVRNRGEEIELNVVQDSISLSRNMVSEYMVLVGELTAKYALKNDVPIPFRSQASRRGITSPAATHLGQSDEWTLVLSQLDQMSKLCAAQTETDGKPHAGLAVDSYCQVTSPIRRYLDLLVHYQIKAALRGDNLPFDRKSVQKMIAQAEQIQAEISKLTANSIRYWMLRYLERQPPDRIYSALVTGIDFTTEPPSSSLLFVNLGWRSNTLLERNPSRGELVKLYISYIDAFNDIVRFNEVSDSVPAEEPSYLNPV